MSPMDDRTKWPDDVRNNLPLIIGFATTFFVAFRILSAAGFDMQTAYAVLQAAGTGQVLAGAALGAITFIPAAIVIGYLLFFPSVRHLKVEGQRILSRVSIVLFWIISFLAASAIEFFLMALVVAAARGREKYTRRKFERQSDQVRATEDPEDRSQEADRIDEQLKEMKKAVGRGPYVFGAMLLFLLAVALVSTSMWLPAEQLEFRDRPPVIGYVLSEAPDSTSVLIDNPRKVLHFRRSEIVRRFICRQSLYSLYDSFPELITLSRPSRYPKCKSDHPQ